ncbi:hypothetical protein IG631_01277 [Alternaria alternata]|nr:hypothetical protein IG631_01277 [Alternaria alternata]
MAVIFEGCGEDAEVEATVAAGAGVSGTGGECHRRLFGVAAYVGRGMLEARLCRLGRIVDNTRPTAQSSRIRAWRAQKL